MHIELDQVEGRRFRIKARGMELIVDDTVEAGGPGDGFRPSELLMGALSACMAGTMLNFANNQGIDITSISMTVDDEAAANPSRISNLAINMQVGSDATDRQIASLERVAAACKIHNTLEHSPSVELGFSVQP